MVVEGGEGRRRRRRRLEGSGFRGESERAGWKGKERGEMGGWREEEEDKTIKYETVKGTKPYQTRQLREKNGGRGRGIKGDRADKRQEERKKRIRLSDLTSQLTITSSLDPLK